MNNPPICPAPWHSILIDTNKDVKPCCAYYGHIGNLNRNTLENIISGPVWSNLKNKLSNQEWPEPCISGCKNQEDQIGWSVRLSFLKNNTFNSCGHNKISYLELNGSNICNLACLHCSPKFSSKWLSEWNTLSKEVNFLVGHKNPGAKHFSVDPSVVLENLESLDLSELNFVVFKGGDPMLNDETLTALRYFDKLSILSNIKFNIFTNGTIVNQEVLSLLNKAKQVMITVSLDGVGKLNEYIRYGTGSNSDDIKKNIDVFNSSIKNFQLSLSVSTMIYNIFNLVEIRDFWKELTKQYNAIDPFFNIIVTDPKYLDPRLLPFEAREKLIEFYKKNQRKNEFEIVIKGLAGDYLGDKVHNNWVTYTNEMEKIRGNSIIELVPELEEFLYYK